MNAGLVISRQTDVHHRKIYHGQTCLSLNGMNLREDCHLKEATRGSLCQAMMNAVYGAELSS